MHRRPLCNVVECRDRTASQSRLGRQPRGWIWPASSRYQCGFAGRSRIAMACALGAESESEPRGKNVSLSRARRRTFFPSGCSGVSWSSSGSRVATLNGPSPTAAIGEVETNYNYFPSMTVSCNGRTDSSCARAKSEEDLAEGECDAPKPMPAAVLLPYARMCIDSTAAVSACTVVLYFAGRHCHILLRTPAKMYSSGDGMMINGWSAYLTLLCKLDDWKNGSGPSIVQSLVEKQVQDSSRWADQKFR